MHIVVDLQACQTPDSRQRGIGRYSLELAKAIVRNRGAHCVRFLVNRAFDEHIDALKAEFESIPELAFEAYDLAPLQGIQGAQRRALQRMNDAIINWRYACTGADVIHISSVFEGWLTGNAHVTGRPGGVVGPIVSATLYDLIPLLFSDVYLAPEVRTDYFTKLGVFQQLDVVLAISESARQDAIRHLALQPERVVNIGAATSGAFHRLGAIDDRAMRPTLAAHGIGGRFVLYTGGIDYRKNIELLLDAYAALPVTVRADVQLAIVCSVMPEQREEIMRRCSRVGIAAGRVVLPGYVSDSDLNLLYNACELFIFPSLYEGFGLPVLEAMTCGACVIASDAASMPEILGRADVLFNPRDPAQMMRMMNELLGNRARRLELSEYNVSRASEFSWDRCGREAVAAFEDAHARKCASWSARAPRARRIAMFSPLPPQRSGIASYSAAMLPHWSRYWDIDVVVDEFARAPEGVPGSCTTIDIAAFRRRASLYDGVLYHFGNSEFHAAMFDELMEYPGVVVMHDFYLSGLLHWMDSSGRQPGIFEREMLHAHGAPAQEDLAATARGDVPLHDVIYRYPASRSVIERAQGIIFHSAHARQLFARTYPDLVAVPTCVVPHFGVPESADVAERAMARAALRLAPGDRLVCAFGFLAETKLNHVLLDALAMAPLASDSCVRVAFVGELPRGEYGARIRRLVAKHPLRERIDITGYVSEPEYRRYLVATDIAVSLRALSRGETSGALQKNLAAGCATIVSEYAAMAELPDAVVYKIPPHDVPALATSLKALVDDDGLRHALGEAARAYVARELHPAQIARQYAASFDMLRTLDDARCARRLIRVLGRRIRDDSIDDDFAGVAGSAVAAGIVVNPAAGRRLRRRS